MLQFQPLELEHIPVLRPSFPLCPSRFCDLSFGVLFLWRDYYQVQFAMEGGVLYLKWYPPGRPVVFSVLSSGEEPNRYDPLVAYCEARSLPLTINPVSAEELPELRQRFPGARAESNRDWSDYLYLAEEMRAFRGKKWNGQRNHVNHFCRLYPDWRFEVLDETNLAEAEHFFQEITEKYPKHAAMLVEEHDKTLELLHHYSAYGQNGGLLRAGGAVVGLSIGEAMGDTLVIHIEKADREYPGVYPMLVQQFARAFTGEGVTYINREEDTGDPGLRSSKLSYHPIALLEKFVVFV